MNTENVTFKNLLTTLLPGASHGIAVTVVGHPFDTIKTRAQSGLYSTSAIESLKKTIRIEGTAGLYRGAMVPLISHVVKRSYQFPIFDYFNDNKVNPYMAGIIAGSTGSITGVPLQVIKINTQTSTRNKYRGAWHFIKDNYKNNGLRGFYRGFGITLMKDSIFSSSFFGNYTYFKKIKLVKDNGHTGNFVAGGLAQIITYTCFIPIDYVKTHVQKNDNNKTVTGIIQDTFKTGRYKMLWRGIGPAVLRIFPTSGCGMVIYEIVKKMVTNID